MTDLYQGYHMPDLTYRHFGPVHIDASPTEMGWLIAAVFSAGIILGLCLAFGAVAIGGSL